jgi:hypothetical protein
MAWDAFDLESAFPREEPLKPSEICLAETNPPETNPQPEYRIMNLKRLLPCLAAILLASPLAFADTIAKWTFETSQPGVVSGPASPGAGVWITNIVAETPTGIASGLHAGAATYSSPAGNGSAKSFSSQTWAVGDFYQFVVRTVGFQNVTVSYDQISSPTGPGIFAFEYSTDGSTFSQFGSTYIVSNSPTWSSGSYNAFYTHSVDLSSITALNNAPVVYFRIVVASSLSSASATNTPQWTTNIATTGTDRIDNFLVSASTIPGFPAIITQPQTNTVYWGDTAYLDVTATGTSPLSYQWYYPDMSHPLSDGGNGHVGAIIGSLTNTLILTYIDPSQAGNYQVIVGNSLGSITSQVARLTVGTRTPIVTNIAYLRASQDRTTWLPTDTTNLYSVTGVVTTPFNLSGATSTEFFMQDGASGICVFLAGDAGASLPNQGDLVRVIGPVANYNGLLELNLSASNPSHSLSFISGSHPLPAPKLFDINNYSNIPYMETNIEGSLVVISNVFLQQATPTFVDGSNVNMTNGYRKYLPLYINGGLGANDIVGQTIPTIAASIAGVMSQFASSIPATNGYELDILRASDLTSTTQIPPMALFIQKAGANVLVSWWAVAPFTLQASPTVDGTYTNFVTGTNTPVTNSITSPARFFRLKQN